MEVKTVLPYIPPHKPRARKNQPEKGIRRVCVHTLESFDAKIGTVYHIVYADFDFDKGEAREYVRMGDSRPHNVHVIEYPRKVDMLRMALSLVS